MFCSQKARIIEPKDRSLAIVPKALGCLQDRTILSEPTFRTSASTTTVFSSRLHVNKTISVPVVLKFWNTDNRPSQESLRVHNLYVAIRRLRERREITTLIVPTVYFSFLDLRDGRVLVLPTSAQTKEDNPELPVIRNQLVVVDDLAEGKGYKVITVSSDRLIPSELREGVERDIARILRYTTKREHGDQKADLFESLFVIESNPPRVAIGDVDKLDPINVPGIERFEIDLSNGS